MLKYNLNYYVIIEKEERTLFQKESIKIIKDYF